MSEIWKSIPEYPGYDASNHGRVQSYYKRSRGSYPGAAWTINDEPQRILAGAIDKSTGYCYVRIKHESGDYHVRRIHWLITLAFLGPRPKGLEVCHNDGNPQNNHLNNLRYDTHINNVRDACIAGALRNNLTAADILTIRNRYAAGESSMALACEFGVSRSAIKNIYRGDTHKYIGGPRTFGYRAKTSSAQIREMRELRQARIPLADIAKRYNISVSHASRIVRGLRHKEAGGPIWSKS